MPTINGHELEEVESFLSGKSQRQVFNFLNANNPKEFTADAISKECDISVTGVHRVLKCLIDKKTVIRKQNEYKRNVHKLNFDKDF